MVREDVVKYLKEGMERGFSLRDLKDKLLDAGFDELEVNEASAAVDESSRKDTLSIAGGKSFEKGDRKIDFGKGGPSMRSKENGDYRKMLKIFSSPAEVFEKSKLEGVWPSLKYHWKISAIPVALMTVLTSIFIASVVTFLGAFFGSGFNSLGITAAGLTAATVGLVLGFFVVSYAVIIPITYFFFAGILHFVVKVYGGTGGYSETFGVLVYGGTPGTIFAFIPFLNFATTIWSFVLQIFGISIKHNLSKIKSFFVLATIPLIIAIIYLVVWIVGMFVG